MHSCVNIEYQFANNFWAIDEIWDAACVSSDIWSNKFNDKPNI